MWGTEKNRTSGEYSTYAYRKRFRHQCAVCVHTKTKVYTCMYRTSGPAKGFLKVSAKEGWGLEGRFQYYTNSIGIYKVISSYTYIRHLLYIIAASVEIADIYKCRASLPNIQLLL